MLVVEGANKLFMSILTAYIWETYSCFNCVHFFILLYGGSQVFGKKNCLFFTLANKNSSIAIKCLISLMTETQGKDHVKLSNFFKYLLIVYR